MPLRSRARAGSLGALAVALAAAAIPASAQEVDRDQMQPVTHAPAQAEAVVSVRQEQRAERREERRADRAERAASGGTRQAPSPVPPIASRPDRGERHWNRGDRRSDTAVGRSGRDWNRRDNSNNDWGQARAAQAHAEAQARAEARARSDAQAGARVGGWQRGDRDGSLERNRSYRDPSRSTNYRDGYRGDQRQADNVYSSGFRDGARTEHYRDGRRWDGRRHGYNSWSHDWRRDHRYNWYGYRDANRHVYRLGRYYSPYRNYRYGRLNIGFHLDSLFFGSRYWINDPWQYRLPTAYGPYRWVRYYDDALLVNTYTGQVVDVIYDFFW